MASSLVVAVLIAFSGSIFCEEVVNVCDEKNTNNSFIYCKGRILEAANYWMSESKDIKSFVDSPLLKDPLETEKNFNDTFGEEQIEKFDNATFQKFLNEHFAPPGQELEDCQLTDWQENPPYFQRIHDENYRNWALELNKIWKKLCKKMKSEVERHPSRHSLIYVPNKFVVPGGRFREFYYWDTFWIIRGLLVSGMNQTAANMIRNLVFMVEKYGFVPNGGRIYYLKRSQPPFLIPMVYSYYKATRDIDFVHEVLPLLEREFKFWENNRTVTVSKPGTEEQFQLFHFNTRSNVPRPESYRKDITAAENITSEKDKREFWRDVASAAESGWDFSSRWFRDGRSLQTIRTRQIVPVDLNAILCWNMDILQLFFRLTGNVTKAREYEKKRFEFRRSMSRIFYNDTEGAWFDWDRETGRQNLAYFPSVAAPLFTGSYDKIDVFKPRRLFHYLQKVGALEFPGGIPTSLTKTGQQWDLPNAWPPVNHMLIHALQSSTQPRLQDVAFELASKWLATNYRVYYNIHPSRMYEKYNAETASHPGQGGEYGVQEGFGWTNGVALDLLYTYGHRLEAPDLNSAPQFSLSWVLLFPCFWLLSW